MRTPLPVLHEPAARESTASDPPADAVSANHSALVDAGWERRFVAAPPRLQEMTELYRSLGREVRHESVDDTCLAVDCAGCALARTLFRVIYTRKIS